MLSRGVDLPSPPRMASRLFFWSPNGFGMFRGSREHGFSSSLNGRFRLAFPQELTEIKRSSDRVEFDVARARLRSLKRPKAKMVRSDPDSRLPEWSTARNRSGIESFVLGGAMRS